MAAVKDQSFARLPNSAKAFLLVMVLGLIGALFYFVLLMPLDDEIASAQKKATKLRQDLVAAKAQAGEYVKVTAELAQRDPIDRRNKRSLPESAEIASFLQDLNRLAELSGLDISLVEPRPEEASPNYVRVPVVLGVRGRYHEVAKFFFNVSRLERAISMENLKLALPQRGEPTDAEEIELRVDVLATTYRRPAAPPPAPAGGNTKKAKRTKAPAKGGEH